MDQFLLLRFAHLVGLMLLSAGLLGVFVAAMRSRQVRDVKLFAQAVTFIAVFYDGLVVPGALLLLVSGGRDGEGWLIGEILALNDHERERRHDFIQWLFALPEPSRAQPQSPILTPAEITAIRENSAAQENLIDCVCRPEFLRPSDHRETGLRRGPPA